MDTDAFATRFRAKLLDLAAANRGVTGIEAYRAYQTNADFHAMIEAIVFTAVQALMDTEVGPDSRLSEVFSKEASTLLGWDDTMGKYD